MRDNEPPAANPGPYYSALSLAFERGGVGAWIFDVSMREFVASVDGVSVLRLSDRKAIDSEVLRAIVDSRDMRAIVRAIRRALRSGATIDLQFRFLREGGPRWMRMIGGAVARIEGEPRALSGVIIDIDDQKRSEERLRDSQEHLRSILETAIDGMVVIDENGIIGSFSRAAEAIFGYSRDEAVGQNVGMLMAEPHRGAHDEHIARYLRTGENHVVGFARIVEGLRKDGSSFPMRLSVGEMKTERRHLFTGFIHDLTEERRTRDRLEQLQREIAHISRVSEMGAMGSTLAHELNQPLSAISNYLKGSRRLLAAIERPATAKVEVALDKAAEQAIRAGQIIRRLREFVSRRESERSVEALTQMIEEASALGLVGARERGVTLSFDFAPGRIRVLADRVQVQQVLVNLFRNALEAMEDSSRRELVVTTRRIKGDMVEVSVADTGHGLPKEVETQLFQAFFTTKKSGLGVGLSISRSIIEAHGGRLWAETNRAGGATFHFTLPIAATKDVDHAE